MMLLVEGGGVGIRLADDLHDACDSRHGAARVIEEGQVALLHVVTHEITYLVVAYAIPSRRLALRRGERVDAEALGFGLHQPVLHVVLLVGRDARRLLIDARR